MLHMLLPSIHKEYLRANYIVHDFFYNFINKENGELYLISFLNMVEKSDLSEEEKYNIIMVLFQDNHEMFKSDYFACINCLSEDFDEKNQKTTDEMVSLIRKAVDKATGLDGDTIKKYEGAVVAIKRNFGYDKERYAEDSSLNLQREILVSNAYRAIITNGSLNEEQIEGLSDVLNSYIISLLRRTSTSQQPQQLVKKPKNDK